MGAAAEAKLDGSKVESVVETKGDSASEVANSLRDHRAAETEVETDIMGG